MDTAKFSEIKLTPNKLDNWIALNYNVMLVGEKGVGKSAQVIEAFQRHNLNWQYFSGATLDPWTDLIGVPKPKTTDAGVSVLEYIRPDYMNDELEAIFVDEYNRSHKKVKSALMELVQFKSINGKKFNKLRFVWAAINPTTDDDSYDVEKIDPAQLDRFHVIVNIRNEPDRKYFQEKYPNSSTIQFIEWWLQQPKDVKGLISPRRLEYAVQAYKSGGDLQDILPRDCNYKKLREMLRQSPTEVEFRAAFKKNDIPKITEIINDSNKFEELKETLFESEKYFPILSNQLKHEKLVASYKENELFKAWMNKNPTVGKNKEIINEIRQAHPDNKQKKVLDDLTKIMGQQIPPPTFGNAGSSSVDKKELIVRYCEKYVEDWVMKLDKNGQNKNSRKAANSSLNHHFAPKWRDFVATGALLSNEEVASITTYLHATIVTANVSMVSSHVRQAIFHLTKIVGGFYGNFDYHNITNFEKFSELSSLILRELKVNYSDLDDRKMQDIENEFAANDIEL